MPYSDGTNGAAGANENGHTNGVALNGHAIGSGDTHNGHTAAPGSNGATHRSLELKRGGFIASYPPFETLQPGGTEGIWDQRRFALYAHLPYCRKRCTFCFYKVYTNRAAKPMDPYLKALHAELDMYGSRPDLHNREVQTMYFGGGTPTTLSVPELRALVARIHRNFNIAKDVEFTCESEPGTLDARKVAALRDIGVTRLSMGVQTFDDELLKKNGRSHGSHQVYRAMELARQNDFPVINIDLMSGIVDETMQTWERSVQTLIDLKIEHVSIYRMEVYKNTLLYAAGFTGPGVGGIPTDEEELEMWLRAVEMLEGAGYIQISGHAFIKQPEHDHIHRTDVWGGGDLLATGVGSYSYLNNTVFQNTSDWDTYVKTLAAGQSPVKRWIRLNDRQVMAREVVLGLKLLKVDRVTFRHRHGFDVMDFWGRQVEMLVADGLLEVTDEAINVTRRGRIYIDILCSVFYLPEHTEYAFHRFATEHELAEAAALQANATQADKHFSPLPLVGELALAR